MTTPEPTNSWNVTGVDWDPCTDSTGTVSLCSAHFVLLTITLVLIDILVIVGNTLVILAVVMMPRLRTVTNIFIVSLACSDLLLGVFVLPFSLTRQAMGYWVFPEFWCPVWLVTDVWVCTASILNLCIISFDRYIAITRPIQYPNVITHFKGKVLVTVVWIASFAISFPPLIGWNDWQQTAGSQATVDNATEISAIFVWNQTLQDRRAPIGRVETNYTLHYNDGKTTTSPLTHLRQCELNSVRGYRVYSALGSFFIPAIILVFFYYRIYRAARRTAISISKGRLNCKCNAADGEASFLTLRIHRGGGPERTDTTPSPARNASPDILSRTYKPTTKSVPDGQPLIEPLLNGHTDVGGVKQEMASRNDPNSNLEKFRSQSISSDSIHGDQQPKTRRFSFLPNSSTRPHTKPLLRRIRRETKAAKTLGIIVGCFLFCWMPFFTVYFIEAFCAGCITPLSFDITFWIGYCNSMLNPCIYAMFSRDFRFAFKKLLCLNRMCTNSKWVTTFPMKSSSRKPFSRPDLVSDSSERAK